MIKDKKVLDSQSVITFIVSDLNIGQQSGDFEKQFLSIPRLEVLGEEPGHDGNALLDEVFQMKDPLQDVALPGQGSWNDSKNPFKLLAITMSIQHNRLAT